MIFVFLCVVELEDFNTTAVDKNIIGKIAKEQK
jgi:hypothetical protein